VAADTALMNERLQDYIDTMPEQYYWVHKRFKTRPPGEAGLLSRGQSRLREEGRQSSATSAGPLVHDPVRGARHAFQRQARHVLVQAVEQRRRQRASSIAHSTSVGMVTVSISRGSVTPRRRIVRARRAQRRGAVVVAAAPVRPWRPRRRGTAA
jgi:hypothetical protein